MFDHLSLFLVKSLMLWLSKVTVNKVHVDILEKDYDEDISEEIFDEGEDILNFTLLKC